MGYERVVREEYVTAYQTEDDAGIIPGWADKDDDNVVAYQVWKLTVYSDNTIADACLVDSSGDADDFGDSEDFIGMNISELF